VVVDIETTGLSKSRHAITEISALKVDQGEIIDEFTVLVNPQRPIPRFITKLTGINNALVRDQPPIDKLIPHFTKFLGDLPFVGHNARFDYGFLNMAMEIHLNKTMLNDVLCSARFARRLLPELPSKRLGAICEHFDITNEAAHRARGDALATSIIFNRFLTMLKERGIDQRKDILRFQSSPIPKRW